MAAVSERPEVELPGSFRPKTGSLDAWNAAYVRVEDYLRAHRIHNRLHQSRLIQRILERAARRHEQQPAIAPTTLAAEERVPREITEAMRDSSIKAGPDLAVSSMVPRTIDFGRMTEVAGDTLERIERWPIMRTLILWSLFSLVLAGIFYASR